MNLIIKHLLIGFLACFFLGGSLFLLIRVDGKEQARKISFGWPLAFTIQDFENDYEKHFAYPWYQKIDIKKGLADFSLPNFIFSFLFYFLSLEAVIFLGEFTYCKIRKRPF